MVGFKESDSSATYTSLRGGGLLANYNKNGGYSVTLEINGTVAVTSKEELDNIYFGSLEDVKNV